MIQENGVSFSVKCRSARATKSLAAKLMLKATPPLVFALTGDLGSGKTTFVQGAIQAMSQDLAISVQSPSFAIAKSYATPIPIHHIDLYRLPLKTSLVSLGIDDLIFDETSFCFVEWPERYGDGWPNRVLGLKFNLGVEHERIINIFVPPSCAEFIPFFEKIALNQ